MEADIIQGTTQAEQVHHTDDDITAALPNTTAEHQFSALMLHLAMAMSNQHSLQEHWSSFSLHV